TRKKYNLFSILGLVSVLLTGGIGILNIPTEWFAIKEAAIPALLGVAVVVSLKTPYPLIRTLLYNPEFIDVDRIQLALTERKSEPLFERLLVKCTLLIAGSFLISAALNYTLARWIVVSPSGTDAFNAEVGKMMAWSWPIIAVPGMVMMMLTLWMLINGINKMTGLKLEEILHGVAEEKK
ncbi:MAG: VC0807 family protein, partial [Verrucomicrobiota bacterium]